MPVLVRVGAITVPAYALLDSGATCSAISSDLAQEIEAKVNQIPLTLRTFGAKSTTYRKVTSFTVHNLFETLTMKVKNALVSDLLGTDRDKPPNNEITERYPHLKDVHFTKLRNPAVRLILDAKHAHSWLPKDVRIGRTTQPVAVLSKLGWYLIGDDKDDDDTGQKGYESDPDECDRHEFDHEPETRDSREHWQ